MAPLGLTRLPAEIIIQIFGYLETSSTAEDRLRCDPEYRHRDFVKKYRSDSRLKAASLVCRQWRHCIVPLLFTHVIWTFDRFFKPPIDVASNIEVLAFLRRNHLSRYVEHFIILIKPPPGHGISWRSRDRYWGILPAKAELYYVPRVIHPHKLDRWLGMGSNKDNEGPAPPWDFSREWNNNWLWHAIFAQLDPLRITLIGSKGLLASLLSRSLKADLSHYKELQTRLHGVSLSRESRITESLFQPSFQHIGSDIPIDLFRLRPWTSVLINDSLCSDYLQYEDEALRRKSVLFPLLFDLQDPSMRRLYKGVRTISCIFNCKAGYHLYDVLKTVPPVESLDVQFVPRDLYRGCTEPQLLSTRTWDAWNSWDLFCHFATLYLFPKSFKQFGFSDEMGQETWNMVLRNILPHLVGDWEAGSKGRVIRCNFDQTN